MGTVGLPRKILRFVKQQGEATMAEIVAELAPRGHPAREIRGCVVSMIVHGKLLRSRTAIMLPAKGSISLMELGRRIDRAIVRMGFLPKASAKQQLEGYGKTPKDLYDV